MTVARNGFEAKDTKVTLCKISGTPDGGASETNEIRSPRVARGFLPDATWGGRTHASQGI